MFAFAVILYEIIGRKGPFGQNNFEPKQIIELVKQTPCTDEDPFRPDIDCILDSNHCADYIISCIKDAWDEDPELRPDFPTIRYVLLGCFHLFWEVPFITR